MGPLRNYKCADGVTRQYREGEQPESAALVEVAAMAKQTPEARAAKAPARRRAVKKEG